MKCTLAWARTFPPTDSEGWTLTVLERESRYWVIALAGPKDDELFRQGTEASWLWAQDAVAIRWFTDGERRYGKMLWPLASEYLPERGLPYSYWSAVRLQELPHSLSDFFGGLLFKVVESQ
jgi:hypothetical protein